jgi:hypothetical protein
MPRALPLILLAVLTGCYTYVPQRPGTVPPGADVRIRLSSDGVERIGEAYGSASGVLEGRLENWSEPVEITFPVPPTPGMVDRGLRSKIFIPQADIVAVDLRQRDRTKTAILSASLGVLTFATAYAMFSGVFGGSPPDNGPPLPEDIIVPFWIKIFP